MLRPAAHSPATKWRCEQNRTVPRPAVHSPATARSVLVLPAPEGPTMRSDRPALTCDQQEGPRLVTKRRRLVQRGRCGAQ